MNMIKKIYIYRSDWKLEVWKMLVRFGKFKARFVDLLYLQFSRLTKLTGLTKPTNCID